MAKTGSIARITIPLLPRGRCDCLEDENINVVKRIYSFGRNLSNTGRHHGPTTHFRKKYSDARTAEGKALRATIDAQPSVLTDEGELLPALKNSYLGYSESLRRDVEWLYNMAARRPSRLMDLETYLKAKKVDTE